MPADNAYPDPGSRSGSGSGHTSVPDPAFEQTLRELLELASRSVAAPPDLTARVCTAPPPPRRRERRGRRRALVLAAAAVATTSVLLGGLAVNGHRAPDRGLNVITPADGSPIPERALGATGPPGVGPTSAATAPPAAPATADQATVDEITRAFTEAFDADDSIGDGLAYVENGELYRDITRDFIQRYPGVLGNLEVRLTNIMLMAVDRAQATIIITHTDPDLGEQWGYEITRRVDAVRVDGRWLVGSSAYSFLVGSS